MKRIETLFLAGALVGGLGAAGCTGAGYVTSTGYQDPTYVEPTYGEPAYKPDPVMSDAEIHDRLYTQLATIPGLDLDSVAVHVHEGVVHFEGHVHSQAALNDLEEMALSIPGVHHVDVADVEVATIHRRQYAPY